MKEVVGPVPAGTVFEVTVECIPEINEAPSAELVAAITFEFDETGAPIGDTGMDWLAPVDWCDWRQ